MRVLKKVFICCLALLFVPMFFACNEKGFDDVAYVDSSVAKSNIVKDAVDSIAMLGTHEVSVRLKNTTTYTFYKTSDEQFTAKTVKDTFDATIGKQEDVFIATITQTRFVNNKKTNTTKTSYINDGQTSYRYTLEENFELDSSNKVVSTGEEYNRQSYQPGLVDFNYLFKQIMPIQPEEMFASVQEKSFESTKYYKLVAGINGEDNTYETLNDSFSSQEDIFENPQMYRVKDKTSNYVMPFVCEYGFSEVDGENTIVYFTTSYNVQKQDNYEKYLSVYSTSKIENYGTKVNVKNLEDAEVYTANAFIKAMQQDYSYMTYKKDDVNYSVLQIKKQHTSDDEQQETIDYFDYAVRVEASGTTHYYFKYNFTTQSYDCFKVTDTINKKCIVEEDFDLDFLKFDFSLQYNNKKEITNQEATEYYYQFGAEDSYINVMVQNNEVCEVNNKAGDVLQNIRYGTDGHGIGYVENIDEYEVVSA